MDKDQYYLGIAEQVSKRSKCLRAQYGSVIVSKDDRIIATAYNGKPRGSCNDNVCYREGLPPGAAKDNCCLHSEQNAIMFSSPEERSGATIYVTGMPCHDCILIILQSGIKRVVYAYRDSNRIHRAPTDESYWKRYGIEIEFVEVNLEESEVKDESLREHSNAKI